MKKKVDSRIRQTLEDAVKNNHRALFLLVGDKGRDQVVNLHYMLSKMMLQARPNVLWCYKKELGFSSNKKKRMKIIKKRVKQGLVDPNKDDPFELFISSTTIRFAYYNESHKILGNTYGMCVLQDFEALTPNLLARTFETVQGGGLIILLINNMSSLKQLYSLSMDVHSRLRTEAHNKVVGRFNERFILSLSDCRAAIVADDELNVLPISSHVRALSGSKGQVDHKPASGSESTNETSAELRRLKESLIDTPPIGKLVGKAKTIDQARALLRFEEAISEKTLRSTVALTASRGRGKSAALGLAVAAAVAHDYSNIFVTSPSPENLRTFFAFLFVGFDALEFQEHVDYEIIQSTDPNMHRAIVRVNIFRHHRQTVQFLDPTDAPKSLTQAELLVIDEAAAIPLPLVEAMLGPYLVFICSTVTGYEGTGRSLSLKLLHKLREGEANERELQTADLSLHTGRQRDKGRATAPTRGGIRRVFREVHMETPIRYSESDPIEHWLYDLLCLEAGGVRQILTGGAPHPDECELYYVERDALFSRHRASEAFLHRIISLFVSSHYKNSPNDLQLLSDAPAHALFVLLAPTRSDTAKLPDVLCAIQVCLEGRISSNTSSSHLSRGQRASGDLIPWTIAQQFQEPEFASLSGARIVRIATHPDVQKMGYGTRAIKLLLEYFSQTHVPLGERRKTGSSEGQALNDGPRGNEPQTDQRTSNGLLHEIIGPRQNIPPLLLRLHERPAESLDYIGVSFGLTHGLYNFWSRLGFKPLYLRLTQNDLTGEHSCIMASVSVATTETSSSSWLKLFYKDFRRRFIQLLGYEFSKLPAGLALSVLDTSSGDKSFETEDNNRATVAEVRSMFSPYDKRRLDSYSRNLVDYHVVIDMVPKLAEMVVCGKFGNSEDVRFSPAQFAILVAIGLQKKSVDELGDELKIQASQVLALFNKVMRKIATWIRSQEEMVVVQQIGRGNNDNTVEAPLVQNPVEQSLGNSSNGTVGPPPNTQESQSAQNRKKDGGISGLERYKVQGTDDEWRKALPHEGDENGTPGVVSIKTKKRRKAKHNDVTKSSRLPVDSPKPKKTRIT